MPRISGESIAVHREQVRRRVFDAFAALMADTASKGSRWRRSPPAPSWAGPRSTTTSPTRSRWSSASASDETARYLEAGCGARRRGRRGAGATGLRGFQLAAGERFHMGLGPQLYGALSPAARLAIREHVVAVESVLGGILEEGRSVGRVQRPRPRRHRLPGARVPRPATPPGRARSRRSCSARSAPRAPRTTGRTLRAQRLGRRP